MDHCPQSLESDCPQTIWSVTQRNLKAYWVTRMPSSSMTGTLTGKVSTLSRARAETTHIASLQHFVGSRTKVGEIYTDNSPELAVAIKHLGWCHATNTPGISQTNSTIELQVQDILHGSRTLLAQAGLPACFWNYSSQHYCFGTNITQHGDRKSAYELRFPQEGKFQHEFYPFGCLVHFMQTKTLKDDDKAAKFAPTGATGILLGYKLHPGGKWRHEYIVADMREFDNVDFRATSDPKKRRKVREQIVQEIRLPDGELVFPLVANYKKANGTVPIADPVGDGQPSGSSNVEPLLLGTDAADGAIDPNHVITIADIFKGPLEEEGSGLGDDPLDPGGRAMMQDTPGAPSDPPPDVPAPAPDVALIEGVPGAVPPELVADTDDDAGYFTHPLTGRRYKQDEYGENVRKTGRPPYISVADYKKMSYRQQLKAKLDYQAAQDTSIIHPNKGGSHTSALPKPATSCPTAAPMGIFGLLLKCKSAEVQVAAAEEQGYATEAPETDDDDVKSHHDGH